MGLKETLNEKMPLEIRRTPEYRLLLNLVKKEKIASTEGLKHYVSAEIKKYRECLQKCGEAGATSNRRRHTEAQDIDFFELIKQKILPRLA